MRYDSISKKRKKDFEKPFIFFDKKKVGGKIH